METEEISVLFRQTHVFASIQLMMKCWKRDLSMTPSISSVRLLSFAWLIDAVSSM
jgi:hypothetical protein